MQNKLYFWLKKRKNNEKKTIKKFTAINQPTGNKCPYASKIFDILEAQYEH